MVNRLQKKKERRADRQGLEAVAVFLPSRRIERTPDDRESNGRGPRNPQS